MKLSIPLKDIMISPGKRFNPTEHTDQDVIDRIKNLYGVIANVMDIVVEKGMVHIEFRDATPEKFKEAMGKLHKGVEEAQKGQLIKAISLFQDVLAVIPENLDARRNMAKAYFELRNTDNAKKLLQEILQLNPKDKDAAIFLGNIYARDENNLDGPVKSRLTVFIKNTDTVSKYLYMKTVLGKKGVNRGRINLTNIFIK